MRRVIIESPYAGDVDRNLRYARRALLDCIERGEAPLASHLLYTQVLDDSDAFEREAGIEAGLVWGRVADATVVYVDHGFSKGMQEGIARAEREGRKVEFRTIGAEPPTRKAAA